MNLCSIITIGAALTATAVLSAQESGLGGAPPPQSDSPPTALLLEDESGKPAKVPWSADQVAGAPDTPEAGDYSTAWAAALADHGKEWLRLEYAKPTKVHSVRIYESYNPGAISKVTAIMDDGSSVELSRLNASEGKWSSEYGPAASTDAFEARVILVEIDEARVPGWNEIDAAALVGTDGAVQWASAATASSSFGRAGRMDLSLKLAASGSATVGWGANQAAGAPDTLRSGDYTTAWASMNPDGGDEWLEVTFATAVEASECAIRETYNPGAIVRLKAIGESGVVLSQIEVSDRASGAGKVSSAVLPEGGISILRWAMEGAPKVKKLRIELDTNLVSGWNEIDAVQLTARDGTTQWADSATASSSYGEGRSGEALKLEVLSLGAAGLGAGEQEIVELQSRVERLSTGMKALGDYGTLDPQLRGKFMVADGTRRKGLPWSAEQATGEPDTPQRGDIPSAWAPKEIAGGEEWLEVTFPKAGSLAGLRVYESNLRGAITGAKALLQNGSWMALDIAVQDAAEQEPRIVTASQPGGRLQTVQTFRVELDTRKTPDGWPEIDAVEFVGMDGTRQWASKAVASSSYSDRFQPQPAKAAAYQRANTLEEANQRIEQLNDRLENLERQLRELSPGAPSPQGGGVPAPLQTAPGQ